MGSRNKQWLVISNPGESEKGGMLVQVNKIAESQQSGFLGGLSIALFSDVFHTVLPTLGTHTHTHTQR